MSEIKIEKGIEIPKRTRATTYPFRDMNVCDSFAVPYDRRKATGMHQYAKHHGIKIAIRTVTENGKKMLRVWRIA